jgi:hypothetical protein
LSAELVESDYVLDGNNVGCFKSGSTEDKGVFHCPGARSEDVTTNGYATNNTDYVLAGFGASARNGVSGGTYTKIYNYPRTMRACSSENSFILDNLQANIWPDFRAYFYNEGNNHNPSAPQGMNVCDGSGGIKWVTLNETFTNSYTGYHCIPKGYYTQFNGIGNLGFTALGTAYVYDQNGNCRQDSTHTAKFY